MFGYIASRQQNLFPAVWTTAALLASVASGGCTGKISGTMGPVGGRDAAGGSAGVNEPPPPTEKFAFTCESGVEVVPDRIYKLTNLQYQNAIRDIVGVAVSNRNVASAVRLEIESTLRAMPRDDRALTPDDSHGRYRRLDQTIQQNEVDGQYAVATRLARALTGSAERLSALVAPCQPSSTTNCVANLIDRLGPRVIGRPLDDRERQAFLSLHGGGDLNADAMADVLTSMFMAPSLIFRIDHGTDARTEGGRVVLSAHESARRLALHLWQTIPDDELWRAATSGSLDTEAGYATQVQRMLADERSRPATEDFVREWLKLDDYPSFKGVSASPRYRAFAGNAMPDESMRDAIALEAAEMVQHFIWNENGRLEDILTTPKAFPRSSALAKNYDLPVWNGTGDPPSFADPNRVGLLTRAAMLSTLTPKAVIHDASTHPIEKGSFLRQYFLCQRLGEPPANAGNQGVSELRPEMSAREKAEVQTQQQGSCNGCHSYMNPMGFATEMFDSLGRARTEEIVYNDAGEVIARHPINSLTVPSIVEGDDEAVSGPEQLVRKINDSGLAEACLVRNYFRYAMARVENVEADGCALKRMHEALVEPDGSLRAMLTQTVMDPFFRSKAE